MHRLSAFLLSVAVCAGPATAKERADGARDGVKVDEMSALRNLVPEDRLEAAAREQYTGMKVQADRQGALAGDDDPQVQRLRAIAKRLIPQANRWNPRAPQWQWEINLIGSKEINAFCMPGGKIGFFSGILDKLKLTDDEVAVVMGHEIAHALREHGRERMAKQDLTAAGAKLLAFGASVLFGVDPQVSHTVAGAGANLAVLSFSRADETEADLVGLDIAARAGFDPRAGIALWQKMGMVNKNTPLPWLSTHPAGKSRIADMRKHMPELMPLFAKAKGTGLADLPPYRSNARGIAPIV
jgi:predicted Zn-dependent protease